MKCRKCLRQLAFLNHPAYRMVFSRDTRFGQRIEKGGFPDVRQANNAALRAYDIPYKSTLFAPSSPRWKSWRCPMRAWTDTDWSRRQSGFPAVHTDRPKSDIDYRFTATTVADRIAATSILLIRALIAAKLPLVSRYHKMFSLHANTFDFWMN